MEAPRKGLSLADLNAAIKAHYQQFYTDTQKGQTCKACGSLILMATCTVAVHRALPGGACDKEEGFVNETQEFPLPYCPQCEGVPTTTHTCIHMGFVSAARMAMEDEEDGSLLVRT
jgi:hypothetical protein